ncbi:hypothetical protein B0H21DRAFT_822391 [Amylocystis lapponica]|nr:hypothetical protein B0H21DRAFT_822391 [Amylocystis lapponica]
MEVLRRPYVYNANPMIKERTPVLWARLRREVHVVHYMVMKRGDVDVLGDSDSKRKRLTTEATMPTAPA